MNERMNEDVDGCAGFEVPLQAMEWDRVQFTGPFSPLPLMLFTGFRLSHLGAPPPLPQSRGLWGK